MNNINMKHIADYEDEKVRMMVFECLYCHFHIGLDETFLDQVGNISVLCPSCNIELKTNYN